MLDAVSRRMSPMRYYLQGLDMREDSLALARARDRSSISVRSDPSGDVSEGKRRGEGEVDVGEVLWGSPGEVGGRGSDDDEDESGSGSGSSSGGEEDEDEDDTEMEESEEEEEDDDGGEVLELFGHR